MTPLVSIQTPMTAPKMLMYVSADAPAPSGRIMPYQVLAVAAVELIVIGEDDVPFVIRVPSTVGSTPAPSAS